jgi:hypothetical protein
VAADGEVWCSAAASIPVVAGRRPLAALASAAHLGSGAGRWALAGQRCWGSLGGAAGHGGVAVRQGGVACAVLQRAGRHADLRSGPNLPSRRRGWLPVQPAIDRGGLVGAGCAPGGGPNLRQSVADGGASLAGRFLGGGGWWACRR